MYLLMLDRVNPETAYVVSRKLPRCQCFHVFTTSADCVCVTLALLACTPHCKSCRLELITFETLAQTLNWSGVPFQST